MSWIASSLSPKEAIATDLLSRSLVLKNDLDSLIYHTQNLLGNIFEIAFSTSLTKKYRYFLRILILMGISLAFSRLRGLAAKANGNNPMQTQWTQKKTVWVHGEMLQRLKIVLSKLSDNKFFAVCRCSCLLFLYNNFKSWTIWFTIVLNHDFFFWMGFTTILSSHHYTGA